MVTKAIAYIDKIAPEHERISCSELNGDKSAPNARYKADDFGGCYRCTLMQVHNLAMSGEEAEDDDDDT
jgi:hypothetical protein